jgi:hypothetical protein
MTPLFGFTIGGLMLLSLVLVAAFSAIDSLGFSSSEKSIAKEVGSTLNLDNPQMCLNFNDPQLCVSNIAYMKKDPEMCVSLLENENDQYDCLSKFFRLYQERVCNYVSANYYSDCMIEAQNWKY